MRATVLGEFRNLFEAGINILLFLFFIQKSSMFFNTSE